ncbi:hypothetical protein M422DRAFT_26567 [Sphaerobolus stellatus SS14]|nr:hypothetical protein M422DRAFT_26567 [Sphaerobolus stellatus SS14]
MSSLIHASSLGFKENVPPHPEWPVAFDDFDAPFQPETPEILRQRRPVPLSPSNVKSFGSVLTEKLKKVAKERSGHHVRKTKPVQNQNIDTNGDNNPPQVVKRTKAQFGHRRTNSAPLCQWAGEKVRTRLSRGNTIVQPSLADLNDNWRFRRQAETKENWRSCSKDPQAEFTPALIVEPPVGSRVNKGHRCAESLDMGRPITKA